MIKNYFILFFFLSFINTGYSLNEIELRKVLFRNYNKNNRPVYNISENVLLKYGLEISNLVYFDQKAENIELTVKNTLVWTDEYLKWNLTEGNPKYIIVNSNEVWLPDLELYNAASKPQIYDKNSIIKVYNDGHIEYVKHLSYSFACKLNLREFPFDIQTCNMLFGSWKYHKDILDIRPFKDEYFKNFSISDKFSHNEWNIVDISVSHKDYEYKCCPGQLWPNSIFSIQFKRNPQKYNIVIIMSIFITLSALCINLLNVYNYRRTYVLVFLPLTLIWLQLHTSSLIPVIEISTKLENIIMCCFFTTIISAFESGILYCILNNNNKLLSKYLKINKHKKIKSGLHYESFTPIKKRDDSEKNMDYSKLFKLIIKFDNIFRISINLIFFITITILLL